MWQQQILMTELRRVEKSSLKSGEKLVSRFPESLRFGRSVWLRDKGRSALREDVWVCSCGMDSQKPVVNLESHDLVRRLFRLFHGTPEESSAPPASRVAPASPAVRARLMALFTKSAAAANCAPHTFKVQT